MIVLVILLGLQAVFKFFTILFSGFLVGQKIETTLTSKTVVRTRIMATIWMVVFVIAAVLLTKAYL